MADQDWTWAELSQDKLQMLMEAEQTLGADILLAYQPARQGMDPGKVIERSRLSVASLNESQIECLQGMEEKLGTVVIAYRRGA